jgi:hypothetical protein
MLLNKIIIALVCLCILLSLFSQGLVSALFDLCAFVLLFTYVIKSNKGGKHHPQ